MDPDSDPDLSLFIAVMTLVIGVMPLFISIMTLIRGLVLRLMASLIVHAPQIVYITGMWSELKYVIACFDRLFKFVFYVPPTAYAIWRSLGVRLGEPGIDLGPWVPGNTLLGAGVPFPLLAHLSRRLIGELIVYQSLQRPSVNIFKHLLL